MGGDSSGRGGQRLLAGAQLATLLPPGCDEGQHSTFSKALEWGVKKQRKLLAAAAAAAPPPTSSME